MVRLPRILASLATLLPSILAFTSPMPCHGICSDTHDPSLIRRSSDGTYFRFSTGGSIDIHTASALTGPWVSAGTVLPSSGSIIANAGSKDAWAPDVHLVGSTYVLYYAVSSFGTQTSAIGVATSTTLESGSWTDHGSTGVQSVTGDDYNAIDPNLIQVDGKNYLTFGSFWADIFQTTLSSSAVTWSKAAPYNIELNHTSPQPSEGAYVYQHSGYQYLFFSSGICCNYDTSRPPPGNEYKIMVCRSENVNGPYVDAKGTACLSSGGTEVLASHGNVYGPGGQGVYNDPTYGDVLYYHYVDTNIGYADGDKVLGVNVIKWVNGWPTI